MSSIEITLLFLLSIVAPTAANDTCLVFVNAPSKIRLVVMRLSHRKYKVLVFSSLFYCLLITVGNIGERQRREIQALDLYADLFNRTFPSRYNDTLALENVIWTRNWKRLMDCKEPLPFRYGMDTERRFSGDELSALASCTGYIFVPSTSVAENTNLDTFIEYVLPLMQHPFVIITADGDNSYPSAASQWELLVTHPLLLRWYTQNYDGTVHPKLHAIPIGLDLHTPRDARRWDTNKAFNDLSKKRQKALVATTKRHLTPFLPTWTPDRHPDRVSIRPRLDSCNASYVPQMEWEEVRKLSRYYSEYMTGLSPHGNGLDCHRTYEMLWYGMMPIVKTSSLDILYDGRLPVIILNEWEDLCSGQWEERVQSVYGVWPPPDEVLMMKYWLAP